LKVEVIDGSNGVLVGAVRITLLAADPTEILLAAGAVVSERLLMLGT